MREPSLDLTQGGADRLVLAMRSMRHAIPMRRARPVVTCVVSQERLSRQNRAIRSTEINTAIPAEQWRSFVRENSIAYASQPFRQLVPRLRWLAMVEMTAGSPVATSLGLLQLIH